MWLIWTLKQWSRWLGSRRWRRLLRRAKPVDEAWKRGHVSPVMLLSEVEQIGPSEVRVLPSLCFSRYQILWGSHSFVLSWAHEVHQRSPLLLSLHQCPMQAALVSPIRQCLITHIYNYWLKNLSAYAQWRLVLAYSNIYTHQFSLFWEIKGWGFFVFGYLSFKSHYMWAWYLSMSDRYVFGTCLTLPLA